MPHKKNLVNKWTPLCSKDSSLREFEGDVVSTDPKLQFEFLLDIFPKLDKEIIQDVLLEYGDSLNEAIEKLQEISEGRSYKPAVKEANDLAVIACSLLADESQPMGANRMDIYEDSEEQFDVLTSPDAGSSSWRFSNNKLFRTGMDFSRSSFNVNNTLFDMDAGKYSELLTNGIGNCVNMYASNGEVDRALSFNDTFNETKDTNRDNVNISRLKSNNFDRSNKLCQKVPISERNGVVSSMTASNQSYTNSSNQSYATASSQSNASLSEDCKNDKDNVFANWRNNSLKGVNSVISDTKVQEVVVNGELNPQKKADAKGLPDELLAAYAKWPHLLSEPAVNSVSKTGKKLSEFYNNYEKSSFNIHSEYPGAFETVSYMTHLPCWTETQRSSFELHHPTANRERNSSNVQPTNKTSDIKQGSSQKHSTKPSSQVNGIFSPQKSNTTPSSSSDTPHNGHQKASTSNDFIYSSANGDVSDGPKKTVMKSRLSASALEFVPRLLASSKPVVQTSAAQKGLYPESSQPPSSSSSTKSPGKKKGSKSKRNKQNGKAEAPAPEAGNNIKLSLESSSFTDVGTGSDAKATARSQKSIDPTDPLGWGDVFSHLTHSLVDPKPQRQKKNRKSCKSDKKITPPDPPSTPWGINHAQPSRESDESELFFIDAQCTSNAFPVKNPMTSSDEPYTFPAKNSSSSSGISGCSDEKPEHGIPINKINSESKISNMFASTARDSSPVSNRLPPSLLGRKTPTAVVADMFQEVSKITSPKNRVLGTEPPPGSPSAPSVAHFYKNKLQFRGVKTPSGVIHRYILEKRPVMVILRGLPGSGKSHLARQLLVESSKMGVQGAVLSTDDYFMHSGQYCFNKSHLSDAHIWNKKRAQQLMKESVSLVIIDNTNSTMWELLPYAVLALEHNYDVQLFEPDTAWKLKVMELTRKNSHGVAKENIKRMKDRWETFTLDDILKRANQSMALRKNPSAVPVEAAQTPSKASAISAAFTTHSPASGHEAPSTKITAQKTSNASHTCPDDVSSLPDESSPPVNQKVQKGKKSLKSSKKCPKTKITLDFLNQSIKKAVVGVSSQVDVSNNGSDFTNGSEFTQAFSYTKRNLSSDAKSDDTVLAGQLSGDSSDNETPTVDKPIFSEDSFHIFSHIQAGKDNIQEDGVSNSIGNCGMSAENKQASIRDKNRDMSSDKQARDSDKNCDMSADKQASGSDKNCDMSSDKQARGSDKNCDMSADKQASGSDKNCDMSADKQVSSYNEENCGGSSNSKDSVGNCGVLSYDMVNGGMDDRDLLADLSEELVQPGDMNEDSALNNTCSTSNSFHTCYSSSGVSLVDYEDAHDGGVLSAKISCDDCADDDGDVCNHGIDMMFDDGVQERIRAADDFNAIDDFNITLNETVRESDKTIVHGHSVFTLQEDKRHSEDPRYASQQAYPVAQHSSSPIMSSFTDYWETKAPLSLLSSEEAQHTNSLIRSSFTDYWEAEASLSLLSSEVADFHGIIDPFEAVSPVVSDSVENATMEGFHSSSIHPSTLVDYSDLDDSEKEFQGLQMKEECIQPYNNGELVVSSKISAGRIPDASDGKLDSPLENLSMDFIDDVQIFHDGERIFTREISIDRLTQSSEDSVACGLEPGSQAEPSIDHEEGLKKKQKKKRVRKGRNQGPFIEDFLKVKSKTENWSSFVKQVTETSDSSGDSVIIEPESPRVDAVSASSQTDQYYFSIVHKLNSPAFNHSQPVDWSLNEIEIMTSSPQVDINERWTSLAGNTNAAAASRRSSNITDQSTVTDEMLEKEEIDLETLQNCFPEYSRKQLEATMAICQNDLEWVTSHLLDSPALFDMEDDDDDDDHEKSLKNNTLKLNKGSVWSETSGRVKSLAELCTTLVRKIDKVDTDDLEMQVIQIGQGRLQKIEMFGRSRLHSLSQENLGDPDYWPDDFVLDEIPLTRPTSITQANDFNITKPAFRQRPSALLKSSTIIPGGPKQNNFIPSLMKNKHTLLSPSEEESFANSSIFEVGNSSSCPLVVPQEPAAAETVAAGYRNQAVLPLEFVRQLESLFGPLNLQMDNGGLALSDSTARKIYKCLKLQTAKNVIKNSNEQQLRNDEALARVLQDEEILKTTCAPSKTNIQGSQLSASGRKGTVPGWTDQLPSWMSQSSAGTFRGLVTESVNISGESNPFRLHSVSETLRHLRGASGKPTKSQKSQRRLPGANKSVWYTVRRRGQVDSLASIMEEEMAREEQQKEQLRILQSTGDMEALATRIKRIELSHLFPSIGPDILEDIFISTGYSKEETIKTLQLSYNIQPAPMSQDKRDILEQVWSKSKEDFQHVEEEYEADIPNKGSEITYDALRKEARFCRQLALDCQQQAHRYQSDGMQGAALFYRQRAKKYREDEQKANAEAAQVLFEKGQERLRMENTLDLHFYHLDEAINAVNMAIEMKEDEYRKRPDKKNTYLNIVTGWGRNSKNGIPKLKPAIVHHLWSRCLQYEEKSPGMLKVYLGKKL